MKAQEEKSDPIAILKKAIKLQVNQNLFEKGIISREMYDLAKTKIVEDI